MHRHGGLPETDDAVLYLEVIVHHLRPKGGDLRKALRNFVWARFDCEISDDLLSAALRPRWKAYTADRLGRLLRVSDAERSALKLTTIGAYDVDKDERERRRKERKRLRDRARREAERRAQGQLSREEYMAQVKAPKPWEAEGISRAAWFRRKRREK